MRECIHFSMLFVAKGFSDQRKMAPEEKAPGEIFFPKLRNSACSFREFRVNVEPVAKADASKHPLSGEDIQRFLRSFEGAAATFAQNDERWTLWLPEMAAGDHPLTPASQVFFPVILRHGQQAIAIRFLYDCSQGKVRYYTSAIPGEISSLPEFENAISELFRHSLPVEPMRERKLGRGVAGKSRRNEKPLNPRPAARGSLAEPSEIAVMRPPASAPARRLPPAAMEAQPVRALAIPEPRPPPPAEVAPARPAAAPREVRRSVRVEIGPRARSVLIFLIFMTAVVILSVACI